MNEIEIAKPRIHLPARVEVQLAYEKMLRSHAVYVEAWSAVWRRLAWKNIAALAVSVIASNIAVAAALHHHRHWAMALGLVSAVGTWWLFWYSTFDRKPLPVLPPPNELL